MLWDGLSLEVVAAADIARVSIEWRELELYSLNLLFCQNRGRALTRKPAREGGKIFFPFIFIHCARGRRRRKDVCIPDCHLANWAVRRFWISHTLLTSYICTDLLQTRRPMRSTQRYSPFPATLRSYPSLRRIALQYTDRLVLHARARGRTPSTSTSARAHS